VGKEVKKTNTGLGVGLVLLGIILLLAQFGLVGQHVFMYFLGVGFVVAYSLAGGSKRYGNVGLLIPGCVILAIAIFSDIDRVFDGLWLGPGWFFLLLGGAFFTVYQVHTRVSGSDSGNRYWPLYPAGGLAGFGLFVALVTQIEAWRDSGILGWAIPVVLIVVGILLLYRKPKQE